MVCPVPQLPPRSILFALQQKIRLQCLVQADASEILFSEDAMPIHDWTRVTAGTWHDFHLAWIAELRNVLNGGLLPRKPTPSVTMRGYSARVKPTDVLSSGSPL